jgi:hypothetical protein
MQNGSKRTEYESIAAQYSAAKAERDNEVQKKQEQFKAAYLAKLAEARFTVTHGLLVTFLTLILWVPLRVDDAKELN